MEVPGISRRSPAIAFHGVLGVLVQPRSGGLVVNLFNFDHGQTGPNPLIAEQPCF